MSALPSQRMPAMHTLFDLHGKVALVTGATRGIGLAVARALGEAGAAVVVSSENAADCEAVARQLCADGLDALGIACDASSEAQVDALAEQAQAWRGRIDVLVCNSGIAPHLGPLASASAELVAAEMCPFCSRKTTLMRASSRAYRSSSGRTCGSLEASSAMHSSQCG